MILNRLKYETAEAHAETERIVDLAGRLGSRGAYIGLLARIWGFYAPFEAELAARREMRVHRDALQTRTHTPRIVGDLRALGMAARAIAHLPRCRALPHLPSYAHLLGGWYVLEGATLGGQVVARMVCRELGLQPHHGCTFFAGYGTQTGPKWRAFGAMLRAAATDSGVEDAIVAGANETFGVFGRWMAEDEMEALP